MPTATCLCSAIHLAITPTTPLRTAVCHCLTCRKLTSSAFSINTAFPREAVQLVRGTPKSYTITGDSGAQADLFFCGDCGSGMWVEYHPIPELRIVKTGVIDGAAALEKEEIGLVMEQWTKRRVGWLGACEGVIQVEEQMGSEQAKEIREEVVEEKGGA